MTEDDGLANGKGSIDVGDGLVLGILVSAFHIILLDVIQALFVSSQTDRHRVLDDGLGKVHHVLVVSGREEHHLAVWRQLSANTRDGSQSDFRQKPEGNPFKGPTDLWIRTDWSWCPCMAIITSASSKTKTLILWVSKHLNFMIQSMTFPGVPITTCSSILSPLETAKQKPSLHTTTFEASPDSWEHKTHFFHPSQHNGF